MPAVPRSDRAAIVRPPCRPARWESVPCPCCGSSAFAPYEHFGDALQYTYVLCRDCQLVYQSPRPRFDADFLQAAYGEYFAFEDGFKLSDSVGGREHRGWQDEVAEILEFDAARTALLDVGACMGEFLYVARDHYQQVAGVEVSTKMAAFTREALGVEVWQDTFDQVTTARRFSCIHLSHVLEHIPNPAVWLAKARELLAPGGVIVINVPHMFSLDRKVKRFLKRIGLRSGRWTESWRTPDHLFEPTIPAMLRFFDAQGFDVLSYYTYSRSDAAARTLWGRIYRRYLKLGSNLRFYIRPR
ncbi:MAG: methyltransferase domain-containing protein [Gemmatimonadales bacterium]